MNDDNKYSGISHLKDLADLGESYVDAGKISEAMEVYNRPRMMR